MRVYFVTCGITSLLLRFCQAWRLNKFPTSRKEEHKSNPPWNSKIKFYISFTRKTTSLFLLQWTDRISAGSVTSTDNVCASLLASASELSKNNYVYTIWFHQFLCLISITLHLYCVKFVRFNLKFPHRHHICNCQHIKIVTGNGSLHIATKMKLIEDFARPPCCLRYTVLKIP